MLAWIRKHFGSSGTIVPVFEPDPGIDVTIDFTGDAALFLGTARVERLSGRCQKCNDYVECGMTPELTGDACDSCVALRKETL